MKINKSIVIVTTLLGINTGWAIAAPENNIKIAQSDISNSSLEKAVLKLSNMDGACCASDIETKLSEMEGVTDVIAYYKEAVAYVTYDPKKVTTQAMIKAIQGLKNDATLLDSKSFPVESISSLRQKRVAIRQAMIKEEEETLGIKVISKGEKFSIKDHLVPGKITIFDFYADWCEPCWGLNEEVKEMFEKYPDKFTVRKILLQGETPDKSWKHPVVKQQMKNVVGLPYVKVYSPKGELVYQGEDAMEISNTIEKYKAQVKTK